MSGHYRFSRRSLNNLSGVDPRLILICSRALLYSPVDFAVTDGLRSLSEQRKLVANGKSRTLKSKHLKGMAVDVAAYAEGGISWKWKYYQQIAKAFKKAAAELGYKITWGGDWKSFADGPHFELNEE